MAAGGHFRGRAHVVAAFLTIALVTAAGPHGQERSIDAFFDQFTADWVRQIPNLAVATRYFTGPQQDTLETQLKRQVDSYIEAN